MGPVFMGKGGISARVIAHSINLMGVELVTYELTYPRMVHAELLTHGMLARNAASSRAIPFAKMQQQLTARPVRFGEANPGMQDKGVDHDELVYSDGAGYMLTPESAWEDAKFSAMTYARRFYEAGYHKQVYNRLTEPFQMMKTVLSATELGNFFWLRNHGAADPTLAELARVMLEAKEASTPDQLDDGQWHLPYVEVLRNKDGSGDYYYLDESHVGTDNHITLEDAIKVSAARCAAVSFRNVDYGLEKCREVWDKLVGDDHKHGSAMEHQATPIRPWGRYPGVYGLYEQNHAFNPFTWQEGITHVDRKGRLWSAKFLGFIQNRKLIPGENREGR